MATNVRTTRFSGADWADQLHDIILVGVGGIGSWLALNLARIGHSLILIDPDTVDETNVMGGQMYKQSQIGMSKVHAVQALCRELGAVAGITSLNALYTADTGMTDICITGLDNMAARKLVYESWKKHVAEKATEEEKAKCFFMDGRLTLEMFEVLALQGNKPEQLAKYEETYLFDDTETVELDCTTKQSTFGAMGIACIMTATLSNWLTNQKMAVDFREVPMYQRQFFPIFEQKCLEATTPAAPVEEAVLLTTTEVVAVVESPVNEEEELRLFGQAVDEALTTGATTDPRIALVLEKLQQAPSSTQPEATLVHETSEETSESYQRLKGLFI